MSFSENFRQLRTKHERWLPLAFFVGGFCFDASMLRRIDEPVALIQQAVYLLGSGALICLNLVKWSPRTAFGAKLWHYHEELMHFLLGTLLNAYTIFYFKAASLFTSLVFVVFLCGLLYVNESKRLRESASEVRLGLWSLCLISYLVCLVPILLGRIGSAPFLLALVAAAMGAVPMYVFLSKRGLGRRLLLPFCVTELVFTGLYFAELIPPVPLSIHYMGIYHEVKKADGQWQLVSTRSRWKFWQNGDQSFAARPGDRIYFFVRVFSPTHFSEKLSLRWLHHGARGWQAWDAIPLPVTGGREEGFRGHAFKTNYEPGDWRVQVETHDGRELGRLYFSVEPDDTTGERVTHVDFD